MSATARKEEWPELVGLTAEEGERKIKEEIPGVRVQVVPPNGFVTMDYRVDRVKAGRYPSALRAPEGRGRGRGKRLDLWIGNSGGQPDEIPSTRSTRRPQQQPPEFEPDLLFPEGHGVRMLLGSRPPDMKIE